MNFIFISPNFPDTYWQFCDRLHRNGVNVLGIGDAPFFGLGEPLRNLLTEYYYVESLKDYDQVYRAVAFFAFKYGRIDWLESNNEYWLEQDARLRTDFHITSGAGLEEIGAWKRRAAMKAVYRRAGIPFVPGICVTTLPSARAFLRKNGGYPAIVKPDAGGSASVYRLEDDLALEAFFARKPETPYLLEKFMAGDVCSYDAIADSRGRPLFEAMTMWPPSVAELEDRDPACYTCAEVPEALRELGRRCLNAFGVRSRFVHFRFFRLSESCPGLGEAGDYIALEANMRPGGGHTPDMLNYAHSCDVYQLWADMITEDARRLPDSGDPHFCVCAGRRDGHYRHSHETILSRWGAGIVLCERIPETMGGYMYTAHAASEAEVLEFTDFVHAPAE